MDASGRACVIAGLPETKMTIERELTDIKVYYRIRVITSNIANAGTDADVFIEFIGTSRSSG
jgi:hypothetical protein